ncbi:murein biosynthesis integral membrane protein MurJ [Halobacteriovorax sp. BALOs_7]|uniref:murein biosynthesis integral membrane protein MurJ n=1 Tax=Halobacteriovorax sp. BALOs_7 TaxID=2109558 RepID=UPI000EB74383|nr:murein biosynthesis integral membrane protein MurJ [Halobacteriovorax sp. BALOs_7]AYF43423.1 murein biosynthesis integral membrane protein MurJ [Halobacteriovorax sp. BALOs_7]
MTTEHRKNFLLSSIKMAMATLSSRVLGFAREILMAKLFGASGLTDAYQIAFRIPNMLRDLFAEGAFSAAFVPIFTSAKVDGDKHARTLLWSMAIVLFSVTALICGLIFIFAPELIQLLTNELFTSDANRFEMSILLTRMMSPFLAFVSVAALFMGVLNTYRMFFAPAMAPAFFNIIMIISMVSLPKYLEARNLHPIVSLGVGVLVGGFVQMAIQLPMLVSKGLFKVEKIDIFSKDVKEILKRMSIGTIGVAATQINLLVSTFLATGTVIGAVSWLQYAFRLFQFPVGILGVSIGNSNLVYFSELWRSGNEEDAKKALQTSYITSLFVLMPAMALMFALAQDTVAISFQRGAFGLDDTKMVTEALYAYLIGLPFYGLYKVFSPSFYTLDRPKIPVTISSIAVLINIIFCISLVETYGFKILAMGTSVSMIFIIVTQSVLLFRMLNLELTFFFPIRFFKICLCAVAAFFTASYLRSFFPVNIFSTVDNLGAFSISALGGGLAYLIALSVLGDYVLIQRFLNKLLRRK